jgi:hypothetical protein
MFFSILIVGTVNTDLKLGNGRGLEDLDINDTWSSGRTKRGLVQNELVKRFY